MNRREDESEAPQFPGIEGRAPYKAPEDFYSFYETVLTGISFLALRLVSINPLAFN